MSLNLPPITLTAGQQAPITFPGDIGSIAWIKLANASAFTLTLTNLGSGQDYLQPNEVNVWPMTGVTGAVGVLPSADLTGVTAGISTLFITIYLAGEDKPAGQYPYSLGLLTYVGNNVSVANATSLTNTNQAVGSTIIDINSTGNVNDHNVIVKNDGTFEVSAQSNSSIASEIFGVSPGSPTTPAGVTVGDISTTQTVIRGADVSTNQPLRLFTSFQETGYAAGAGVAAGAGNVWAFPINFKTVMTNTPTITLTMSSSSNCSAAANNITKYGFSLVLTATASGSFFWVGSYTTVGN